MAKGEYGALFGLVFPLLGIYSLYKAVLPTLEYRRFGRVIFEMDPFPGAIGGHLGGQVYVSRLPYDMAVDSSAQLSVRLECVYSYATGSGKHRKWIESAKWTEKGVPSCERLKQGVGFVFRFDVPDHLPEADLQKAEKYHFWRLTVTANIQGIDLNRSFTIPVFQTGEASSHVKHDVSAEVASRKEKKSKAVKDSIAAGNFDLPGLSAAMRMRKKGDEINLFFPMFRNKVFTGMIGVIGGGFSFAAYKAMSVALKSGGKSGVFFGLFSIPFALVGIALSILAIYMLFNTLGVYIRPGQVKVLRRLLFIPIHRRKLTTTDISHLDIKKNGSVTHQGRDTINYFELRVHDKAGKSVVIAESLKGKDVAVHFCNYLAQRLNLESRAVLSS